MDFLTSQLRPVGCHFVGCSQGKVNGAVVAQLCASKAATWRLQECKVRSSLKRTTRSLQVTQCSTLGSFHVCRRSSPFDLTIGRSPFEYTYQSLCGTLRERIYSVSPLETYSFWSMAWQKSGGFGRSRGGKILPSLF